jgi:hypothetical protein
MQSQTWDLLRLSAENTSLLYGDKRSNINRIPLRERKGHQVVTSPIRHNGTIPVDGIELTEGREEMQLADDDLEAGETGDRIAPFMWSRGCRVDVLGPTGRLS